MASDVCFGGRGCGAASGALGPVCGEDMADRQGAWPCLTSDRVQELSKELEANWGLKSAVVGAGAQLQLREEEEEEGGETPEPAQTCLQSQLRQVELDWSRLLADVPAFRTALQEVRTSTLLHPPTIPSLWSWSDGFCLLSAASRASASRRRCRSCGRGWARPKPDWRNSVRRRRVGG